MKRGYVTGLIVLFWLILPGAISAKAADRVKADETPPRSNNPAVVIPEPVVTTTNPILDDWIRELPIEVGQGQLGYWQLVILDRVVLVVTDENADRMRIITPVVSVEDIPEGELTKLMEANFHSALDARYALAHDTLWSAFIHPLGSLSRDEFISGLAQVMNLAETYGTTYTSSGLRFGGEGEDGEREEPGDDGDDPFQRSL